MQFPSDTPVYARNIYHMAKCIWSPAAASPTMKSLFTLFYFQWLKETALFMTPFRLVHFTKINIPDSRFACTSKHFNGCMCLFYWHGFTLDSYCPDSSNYRCYYYKLWLRMDRFLFVLNTRDDWFMQGKCLHLIALFSTRELAFWLELSFLLWNK